MLCGSATSRSLLFLFYCLTVVSTMGAFLAPAARRREDEYEDVSIGAVPGIPQRDVSSPIAHVRQPTLDSSSLPFILDNVHKDETRQQRNGLVVIDNERLCGAKQSSCCCYYCGNPSLMSSRHVLNTHYSFSQP